MCSLGAACQEILNIVDTDSEYPVLSRLFGSFDLFKKKSFHECTHMPVLNVLNVPAQLIMKHVTIAKHFEVSTL
jgi:hypothetical protein